MKNVFVYGSLMFDEVWNRVVSGSYKQIEGQLFGYSRQGIKDEHYPGLIEQPGTVEGKIWLNVDDRDLGRLDEFEGPYYTHHQVFVADSHDRCLDCITYVIRDSYKDLLDGRPWNTEDFRMLYLEKFIEEYVGFNRK